MSRMLGFFCAWIWLINCPKNIWRVKRSEVLFNKFCYFLNKKQLGDFWINVVFLVSIQIILLIFGKFHQFFYITKLIKEKPWLKVIIIVWMGSLWKHFLPRNGGNLPKNLWKESLIANVLCVLLFFSLKFVVYLK